MPRSALKSCCRGTARGAGAGHQLRARQLEIARENTTHSQETQHFRPSFGHNFAGRNRQPFAPPRVIADAGGGTVVKPHFSQLDAVQDAGDQAAHSSHAVLVVALQKSWWQSRTPTKKQTRIQHKRPSAKSILQGPAPERCCCVAERRQSPSLPRRRFGCCAAKVMLAITHADEKANANSAIKTIHKIHLTRSSS
jgi:hypothetical protein